MSLDHYVPQVHLKNFYAPELKGGRMYAFRKTDDFQFTPNSKSICRIDEGSTNQYLVEPRLIEKFLKDIEPAYNEAVASIRAGDINPDVVYVISGFVAYVVSCSPTAMRLSAKPARAMLETTARLLDKHDVFEKPPDVLGADSLTELLEQRKVKFKVDEKYPQAIAISSILERVRTFGNFKWDILINDKGGSPFFTSDFPAAVEQTRDPMMTCRIVPLCPDIAIRIVPNLSYKPEGKEMNFVGFGFKYSHPESKHVSQINRLIVRSAESVVFSNHNQDWVARFVKSNSGYRVEAEVVQFGDGDENMMMARQKLAKLGGTTA